VLFGLDAAYPPVANQPERFYAAGWRFFGGYIGGRAEHVWLPSDWKAVAAAGFGLLPIWVAPSSDEPRELGVRDGNAALAEMQSLGLTGTVALDVENGADLEQYASGFVDAVHAGDCRVVLYGTRQTIETVGLSVEVDSWWLAFWPQSPMLFDDAPPDWSMWQYAAGDSVDYNVAWDDFKFARLSDLPAGA
jgi:hypothetical protein